MQTVSRHMLQKYVLNKKYHGYIPALIIQKTNEFYNATTVSGYIKNQCLYLKIGSKADKYMYFSKQQELLVFLNDYVVEKGLSIVLLKCVFI